MIDYHPAQKKKSKKFSMATSSEERYEKLKKKNKFHDWLWGNDILAFVTYLEQKEIKSLWLAPNKNKGYARQVGGGQKENLAVRLVLRFHFGVWLPSKDLSTVISVQIQQRTNLE